MKRAILLLALAAAGCGEPRYQIIPSTADNTIRFYKGTTGLEAEARVGADSEGLIEGLEFTRGETTAKLGKATFSAKPSATYTASALPMQAYAQQQLNYAEIRRAEWAGFNEFWSNTLQAVAPIVGQYLQGRLSLRQAEMQSPQMREELIRGFAGGQIDLPRIQHLLDQMPEAVSGGFMQDPRVTATLDALRLEIERLRPTSQPGGVP
jgi:hypothetical protein